jgi:hypothetical protein
MVDPGGAAYDPARDEWRELPPAPIDLLSAEGAWNGDELVIWGIRFDPDPFAEPDDIAAAAYDPEADEWRELPAPDVSDHAAGVLTDAGFLLIDDETTLRWDAEDDDWEELPPAGGFDCSEDPSSLVPMDGTALIVASCAADARLLDLETLRWRVITNTPSDPAPAWGARDADDAVVHAGRWDESALYLVGRR